MLINIWSKKKVIVIQIDFKDADETKLENDIIIIYDGSMVNMSTIGVLLIIAFTHNELVFQLDVTSAFLHGNLNEIVYMKQL